MRRVAGMAGLAALLVLVVGAPAAWAGTYDVVSCGAPGAAGVNKAWTPGLDSLNGTQMAAAFDFIAECPGTGTSLVAQSKQAPGVVAHWSHSAFWELQAPAGTAIRKIVLWRWGQTVRTDGADANDPTDDWDIVARTDQGDVALEQCFLPNGANECQTGSPAPMSAASRVEYPVNTSKLRWGVGCSPQVFQSCQTADQRPPHPPRASLTIWGSVATIEDGQPPAAAATSGPITADGWRSWTDGLEVSARDATGIRAVSFKVNDRPLSESQEPCDFRDPRPCRDLATSPYDLSFARTLVGDGTHMLAVTVTDPAGNSTAIERPLKIDENGPELSVRPPSGRTIVVDATDRGSGLAAAQIETKSLPDGAYAAVPTRIEPGRIVGQLASGSASRLALRVTAGDAAGHSTVVEGIPSTLAVTRAVVGRRNRPIRGGRVTSSVGRAVTLRGTLRSRAGQPLSGRTVRITSTLRRTGAGTETVGTATTSASGKFSAKVPAGASRIVRLAFDGGGGALPSARRIALRVPASSTIKASPRRVRPGGRVRFSGRLRTAGHPVPDGGKLVDLQAFDRGRWRTFDTARAQGKKARWQASYRFGNRPGRYPIRLRIRREGAFPFDFGYSQRVVVRVR